MHTVRNRSAISRKGKANGRLPKVQPPFLPPDPRSGGAPAFPAHVLVAPPRGAVIRAVPLPGLEPGPRTDAEAVLILADRPARPTRAKATAKRKSTRKAKVRKAKAAPRKRVPKQSAPATVSAPLAVATMSALIAPLPLPPAMPPPERAPTPLPASRAVVRTSGGGMVQRMVRWLDAISTVLIGEPLTRKRRRVALPKARQVLQRRPLSERKPTARQPIAASADAGDEMRLLKLENDRLNRELQLLKAALRSAGSERIPA